MLNENKPKSGRGLYMQDASFVQLDAWISPTFRNRGEVITEMIRVLKACEWRPGYDGLAFLEAKQEAAPVSTPRAASKTSTNRRKQ